ncbi:hypothetical protein O181_053429 [Austropuccinia psidii MF-1]|uniref:Uncharacterized protein n=1 Tax=Austropuccinia psidii MF-1 TaxID=1389203 RepID=A0A9Q3HSM9_9BASI|nr:hypothetical protein [Austropuccinia psidii MF-1]
MTSGNHWRPLVQVQKGLSSTQGEPFSSVMNPAPQEPGMWHIWYYISLCTIFRQQSYGDHFRYPLSKFKSRLQIQNFTLKEGSSQPVLKSMVSIRRPFKDTTHLVLRMLVISFQQYSSKGILAPDSSREISRGLWFFKAVVKVSSTAALIGQLSWSIQLVFRQPVWHWPIWPTSS